MSGTPSLGFPAASFGFALRRGRKRDGGSIILTSSIVGSKGNPDVSVYSATKAVLRSFAGPWTTDLKSRKIRKIRKIRVNVVSPGGIDTPRLRGLRKTDGEGLNGLFRDRIPLAAGRRQRHPLLHRPGLLSDTLQTRPRSARVGGWSGSSDQDEDHDTTCTQSPAGPFGPGSTRVTLTCTDRASGLTGSWCRLAPGCNNGCPQLHRYSDPGVCGEVAARDTLLVSADVTGQYATLHRDSVAT